MCHTGPHVALDFNGATPVMSDELRGPDDDDALMTWGLRRDEMSGGIVLYWAARCAQLDYARVRSCWRMLQALK